MDLKVPGWAHRPLTGLAALMRVAYSGQSLQPALDELLARTAHDPQDAAAWMDISTVLMLSGQAGQALEIQSQALSLARVFRRQPDCSAEGGLRVLALMVPGDLMANTPVDFLLKDSGFEFWVAYVDGHGQPPPHLPEHDVAVMAVGEAPGVGPILEGLGRFLAGWPGPVLNAQVNQVAALTRDGVSAAFGGSARILAPVVHRVSREAVEPAAERVGYPALVRPVGSHAGQSLEKIGGLSALAEYLARTQSDRFYVSPFIDYRSGDGRFRKQRIAFVNGQAFISHMAVSDHWMVHYLSAGMNEDAQRRDEEALFMNMFRTDFAQRHEGAFAELQARVGLDYFGIDCAETQDGRLLLFEVDTAMIVHDLDPDPPFGYKKPHMTRLFKAYQAALLAKVGVH